jgi:hypothetical protein
MKNVWVTNLLSVTLDLDTGPIIEDVLGLELSNYERDLMFIFYVVFIY